MQDFPEPLQIENEDVVVTFPFEVDPQSTLGNVVVYAHNKCCIGDPFHMYRSLWFSIAGFRSGGTTSWGTERK